MVGGCSRSCSWVPAVLSKKKNPTLRMWGKTPWYNGGCNDPQERQSTAQSIEIALSGMALRPLRRKCKKQKHRQLFCLPTAPNPRTSGGGHTVAIRKGKDRTTSWPFFQLPCRLSHLSFLFGISHRSHWQPKGPLGP